MFWLTHSNHGVMPVYSQGEVDLHKKLGWTLLNEGEKPVRVPAINGDTSAPSPQEVIEVEKADVVNAEPMVKWSNEAEPGSIPAEWEAPKRKPGRPAKAK